MPINLRKVFYFSFIATFGIIFFANLLPSSFTLVARPFAILTGFLSILLIDNIKSVTCILLVYIFIILYSLYPLINSSVEINLLLKNTRYSIYFVLLFGLINLLRIYPLEQVLYRMSIFFIVKLLVISAVSINMNVLGGLGAGYILNDINLIVHQLFGIYRVFDIYLILFPFVFIFNKNKSPYIKFFTHLLLFYNIALSLSFGVYFSYFVIMIIRYKRLRWVSLLAVGVIIFICDDLLYTLYNYIIVEKSVSIEVKLNQYIFLLDNISLFGQGLGNLIIIQGRVDSVLENTYIYWVIVYGILGSIFMTLYFVIIPFLICFFYRENSTVRVLFFIHLSILLFSATNPFLESAIGIMPSIIIISYFLSKHSSMLKDREAV